jgi:thiol-disulfide isomerase/thioredoxin
MRWWAHAAVVFGWLQPCTAFTSWSSPRPTVRVAAVARAAWPPACSLLGEFAIYDSEMEAKKEELEAKLAAAAAAITEAEERSALAAAEEERMKQTAAGWRERMREQVGRAAAATARAEALERELEDLRAQAARTRAERTSKAGRLKEQIVRLVAANGELRTTVAGLESQLAEGRAAGEVGGGEATEAARGPAGAVDEATAALRSLEDELSGADRAETDAAAAEAAAAERAAAERSAAETEAAERARAELAEEEAAAAKEEEQAEAERRAAVAAAMRERLLAERAAKAAEAEARAAEERAVEASRAAEERAAAEAAATRQAAAQAMADQLAAPKAAEAAAAPAAAPASPSRTMEFFEAEAAHEQGRDPRYAPPWITENSALLEELAASSTAEPKRATASATAAIRPIIHLSELEEALAAAEAAEPRRLVAVKFYAPWCRACFQVKPLYERLARESADEPIDFYEVDAGAARVLCALANMEKLPVVHVYARGELVDRVPIHTKPLLATCAERVAAHAAALADSG